MSPRDNATQAQVDAADPTASTWLAANAGSGKTRVLTDRVARLLLQNVSPQSVLCLTYTKAAASEMQNRLFSTLGAWAMKDDAPLAAALAELGVDRTDPHTLAEARRLFARAIETPGGLKIQTIHSFCATLLRRFPLEAGVPPGFTEMDDRAAQDLRADILNDLAEADPDLFKATATHVSDQSLASLTAQINTHREALSANPNWPEMAQLFSIPDGFDETTIRQAVFQGTEDDMLCALLPILAASGPQDQGAGRKLAALRPLDLSKLGGLEDIFLYGEKAKNPFAAKLDRFPTKGIRTTHPDLTADLHAFMQRVEDTREDRLALQAARKTHILHQFAAAFLPRYEQRKALTGQLDFDDLILKARDLLIRPGLAEWVLYKLDGGISHILVDEAQDTSPQQWQVIRALTEEFTSGAMDDTRTIFVVGDKKQSIYSFQGADPSGFDRMRDDFARRLTAIEQPLAERRLEYSFRSAPAILTLVDQVFDNPDSHLGQVTHAAFKGDMPGRIDLWPVVEKAETEDEDPWDAPMDLVSAEHHNNRLARAIADEITRMKRDEVLHQPVKADNPNAGAMVARPITDGDILILVQSRAPLFHEIIRACKEAGHAIAGADRLKLGGELAVRDLLALLRFLATPEDDLSLAAALRSPLFGLTEDDLFRLAHPRKGYLWEAMRTQDTAARTLLSTLLNQVDFLRPYDLLMRILLRHDGRRNLTARLGEEAEDGIDAILSQALNYEQKEPPSLTGFLAWMESGEVEIKRRADSTGDKIRVMTVHGAKGLEAPIVFLPETGAKQERVRDDLLSDEDGNILWKTPAGESPLPLQTALEDRKHRDREERQRLLYVAMTRAENWLVVCAAGDQKNDADWYAQIAQGMERAGAVHQDFALGAGQRLEPLPWPMEPPQSADQPITEPWAKPPWLTDTVPAPDRPVGPISPSNLGGAKALPREWDGGLTTEQAMVQGSQIHLLLEHLPGQDPANWPAMAAALLGEHGQPALTRAQRVLTDPALTHIFAPDSLAEVDIMAPIPGATRILHGTIDRLLIAPDHVLAVDFKSNIAVPQIAKDIPDGLLRQMGAYAMALAQIYPNHRIDTAILWTETATLMTLPHGLVSKTLQSATFP
ncbi:double-strand break repair helicase AddA [Actibacterium sp. 188UL27-1]|uniref:double-strand break repair helicase AddA n=1 Tax=Actibacterium sp. 188UL27-1 TaxID=2786961 RepID=UPI00195E0BB7|nr:double-strand break repair helicase AddA [Actibacterium sp. 188UL27-1]MBM7067232.1 double-strand break repair helicase AddA [Actibacterium sp. 188UL27-1]